MGATVNAVGISSPSPIETLSDETKNLPDHLQADAEQNDVATQTENDVAAPGTLLQSPPTQYHTAPQSSELAPDQFYHAPDLCLSPHTPHFILPEYIAYFARLRNLKQM